MKDRTIEHGGGASTAGPSPERLDLRAEVPAELAGSRLDQAAAAVFSDYSRSELARWIRAGELTVNGVVSRAKAQLLGGEALHLTGATRRLPEWQTPQALPFEILYEDADLLVVNKPAGLVVHPGAGQLDGTLVNGLLAHRPALAELPRAGIVHRLDKDTTGLLVVAAAARAHRVLVAALQKRDITRRYLAVVEGVLTGGFTVDKPLGRDPRVRTRQAVREDGREARTEVRVHTRYRAHTLIHAQLETGRTHQIRVHLASQGFPLVGDSRYGARRRLPTRAAVPLVEVLQRFPRQALHAAELQFAHPTTDEPLAFAAPLPDDMADLVERLALDVVQAEAADDHD